MAELLFREQPRLYELAGAKITSKEDNVITLDKTIFYSFSGGQQSDSGTIAGIEVVDSKKEGDEIYYTLQDASSLAVGDSVEIKIDQEKRDRLIRIHSAVHIVGDFFEKEHNIPLSDIIGSNVESRKGRLDYVYPESVGPLLEELEKKVNEFLKENHPINHYLKSGDEWEWFCAGFECPCGGTHASNTSEIGQIKLKRKNIGSGKERIEIYLKED